MRSKTPLLEGSIPKHVVYLALPVLCHMGFSTLYSIVDLYFVGWLGSNSVAALSIGTTLFFFILALGQAIGVGGLALISQAWGRKQFDRARQIYTQALWAALVVGIVAWFVAYLFAARYVAAFTADMQTIELGLDYLEIYTAICFLQLFLMVNNFCFRGSGDFITPVKIMLGSNILNIILDPLLIFGPWFFPRLELQGAALATVLSQLVACGWYVYVIIGNKKNLAIVTIRRPDTKLIGKILKIGLPSAGQYLLLALMILITYRWIKPLGPQTTAAVGVGFRLIHSSYLPMVAISIAAATLVGQNWAANAFARARSSFYWAQLFANAWSLGITTLFLLFPSFFLAFFTDDQQVIDNGVIYIRVFGLSNFLVASIFICTAAFQGLARTMVPLIGAMLKVLIYALLWLWAYESLNLTFIYAAAVLGIFGEFLWDLIYSRKVLSAPSP